MKMPYHLLAVALLALLVVVAFLQAPGFGDDLTYWRLAFELHDRGGEAWDPTKFHHLRWPVWGVCWALQWIFGPGLISFYGEPVLYMAAGAMLAFWFGRRLLGSHSAGWACVVAFLMHPLLDTVSYRPMPDLSEGVWGAIAVTCWLAMMEAGTRGRRMAFCGLTGVAVAVAFSNRITGIFIVGMLAAATLLFHPRRAGWLAGAAAVALAAWCAEALVYWSVTGDFLHSIHANLGARGRKGTEAVALWEMPFRFFSAFWRGNALAPAYTILAAVGAVFAWRKNQGVGRLVVVWAVALYLAYSCAIQGVNPVRPLLRDADRFLASLAIPLSVLAVVGALGLWRLLPRGAAVRRVEAAPVVAVLVMAALLLAVTSRQRFNLDFVPALRRYADSVPDGARVFTEDAMRAMLFLVAPSEARRIEWLGSGSTLLASARRELEAARADELWFIRKIVWLGTRKRLERGDISEQEEWGSYFSRPQDAWRLAEVVRDGRSPDFVFYRRRTREDPPAAIFENFAPVSLPLVWTKGDKRNIELELPVPPELRGTRVRLETRALSDEVQAATALIAFGSEGEWDTEYLLKPYFHPSEAMDFFALEIPATADRCRVRIKVASKVGRIELRGLRVIADPAAR